MEHFEYSISLYRRNGLLNLGREMLKKRPFSRSPVGSSATAAVLVATAPFAAMAFLRLLAASASPASLAAWLAR
jgi:hypothetical protein